jgi:hypothetical protein
MLHLLLAREAMAISMRRQPRSSALAVFLGEGISKSDVSGIEPAIAQRRSEHSSGSRPRIPIISSSTIAVFYSAVSGQKFLPSVSTRTKLVPRGLSFFS